MSTREHDEFLDERPPKRTRVTKHVHVDQPVEEIFAARQLQQLLSFHQDDIPRLRHGISSCKALLDAIIYSSQDDRQQQRLNLLKEYLENEKHSDRSDLDRPYFTQLWQAWSFANSNNSDHLSSAICSHFALLLKVLSSLVDYREYGRLLCRTILQHQHLRLIKRCLDAPKHKEFLLSPSLRLLTEVTQFDGGIFANEVYRHREQTFDQAALRKCLVIVKTDITEEDLRRRPAVRTVAVRYVLSHLRLQDEGGKIDILKQRPLCSTLFSWLRSDPPELVLEILRTCETHVFKYAELPRASKAALLTQPFLDRVLDVATRADSTAEVTEEALRWLKAVCSTPSYGILRSSGWYSPGSTHVDGRLPFDHGAINLGLDSLDFWENPERFEVKNVVLAAWIQTLRPASDLRERELILTCFKAAPELVHAYFKDNALQMDPKLSNTWIGYASFLFEVVNLDLPSNAGNVDSLHYAVLPPQTSIVMSSILPRPLTQKILVRCLNQNDKLISFFIVRILLLALDKVRRLKDEYTAAARQSPQSELWEDAARLLDLELTKTLPPRKDVMTLFRRLPFDNQHKMQRGSTTRLMLMYLTTVPDSGHEESIDVSGPLVTALDAYSTLGRSKQSPAWDILEIEHLIGIAQQSTEMRWYQKRGKLEAAPITTMLKICANDDTTGDNLRELVQDILVKDSILPSEEIDCNGQLSAFDILLASLRKRSQHVWEFLEQCLARVHIAPVKYLDDIEAFQADMTADDVRQSQQILLAAVLLEQASFVVKKPHDQRHDIINWTNTLLAGWLKFTAANRTIAEIKDGIQSTTGWSVEVDSDLNPSMPAKKGQSTLENREAESTERDRSSRLSEFAQAPVERTDHPELFRWQKKDLDLAIEEDDISGLILCLCSQHVDVRRQARSMLETFMSKLLESDLEHKDQLYILIGELTETYDLHHKAQNTALPYMAGTFAVHAMQVQTDPTHPMYSKINQFLMRSPDWRVYSMSNYWLRTCALQMPSEDDNHWKEVQWVLEWLVDGLRSHADIEVLRKGGSLERLMTLYASPAAPDKAVRQRVMEILYRATLLEPATLITRAGALSWLKMQRGDLAMELRDLIIRQADPEHLKSWTGAEVTETS